MYDLNRSGAAQTAPRSYDDGLEYKGEFTPSTPYSVCDRRTPKGSKSRSTEEGTFAKGISCPSDDPFHTDGYMRHIKRQYTGEQQQRHEAEEQQQQQQQRQEMHVGPPSMSSSGHHPHMSLLSPPTSVVAPMGALTDPIRHDINIRQRMNLRDPPKLTPQQQSRSYLAAQGKYSHSPSRQHISPSVSAVFSMSPGDATSLSNSRQLGSMSSLRSAPLTPHASWTTLGEKTPGLTPKVDKMAWQTPVRSLPREKYADFSNGEASPARSLPISCLSSRIPLSTRGNTSGEARTSFENVPQQQPPPPPQQQPQQQMLQVSLSLTNKSSISSARHSAPNSMSSYSDGRHATLGTPDSLPLPAISIPSGTCISLKTTRNGKNGSVNHGEKSPGAPWGGRSMGSGYCESEPGMQVPLLSQGELRSVSVLRRGRRSQERSCVQELLVQEIVSQLQLQ